MLQSTGTFHHRRLRLRRRSGNSLLLPFLLLRRLCRYRTLRIASAATALRGG